MSLRDQIEQGLSGSYAIVRELPGGGMSRVFLAEETSLRRKVVLKFLPTGTDSDINLERFKREIQVVATLQHPHIVPVFSAGEVAGCPYFSMPFVEGESLRAQLERGELPIAEVVAILRDVSKALGYAHAHGVVHRDIKPENILLSPHAASVTDFGVAKALSESTGTIGTLTGTGVTLGTPAYMAPEQAAADPHIDHRADLYAFGVLAYEMLTGRPPFAGRPASQMLAAHVAEIPTPVGRLRESVPPPLASLVDRCLAKRPADRPQSADEVLHVLDTIWTPTHGGAPALRPASRRHVWVGVSVALAAVAAIAAYLVSRPPSASVAGSTVAPVAQQAAAAAKPRFRPTRIVVAPFTNMSGDTSLNVLGALAADVLTNGLSRLDSISVVSGSAALTDSLGRIRRFAGADAVRSLGRETKASTVVWGTIYRHGDSVTIGGQLINVNDGGIELSLEPVKVPLRAASSAIEQLRDQLMTNIDATSLTDMLGTLGRAPRPEAYRAFLEGLQEQWGSGTNRSALPHYAEAARLDPTFVYATYYYVLASSNIARSFIRDTVVLYSRRADSALKVLMKRRSSMTPLELDLLAHARALAEFNAVDNLQTTKRLLGRDSTIRMVGNAALAAVDAGRPYEALSILKTLPIERVPAVWTSRTHRIDALHLTGQFREALAFVRETRKGAPTTVTYLTDELEQLGALGDSAGLARITDSIATAWVPGIGYNIPATYALVIDELDAHGHTAMARSFARRALAWIDTRPTTERFPNRVGLLRFLGMPDSAAVWATRYQLTPVNRVLTDLALGDSTWARARLAELDSLSKERLEHGLSHYQAALLHAALGEKQEAVVKLRAAYAAGYPFSRTAHRTPSFRGLRDYPPFVEMLKPRDRP